MAGRPYQEILVPFSPWASAHFVISDATEFQKKEARLPGEKRLCAPRQVHGASGYWVEEGSEQKDADWIACASSRQAIGVFVADCTALLVAGENQNGPFVAAIHAGWRSTAQGILEKAWEALGASRAWVWVSPSISPERYEVSEDVLLQLGQEAFSFARASRPGHFYLDLKSFQLSRLKSWGASLWVSPLCTYEQEEFFSYRQSQGRLRARHLAWTQLTH